MKRVKCNNNLKHKHNRKKLLIHLSNHQLQKLLNQKQEVQKNVFESNKIEVVKPVETLKTVDNVKTNDKPIEQLPSTNKNEEKIIEEKKTQQTTTNNEIKSTKQPETQQNTIKTTTNTTNTTDTTKTETNTKNEPTKTKPNSEMSYFEKMFTSKAVEVDEKGLRRLKSKSTIVINPEVNKKPVIDTKKPINYLDVLKKKPGDSSLDMPLVVSPRIDDENKKN